RSRLVTRSDGGRLKKQNPRTARGGSGVAKRIRQRPTLPHGFPCSTIGDEGLNFRVRDGNGWNPLSIATGKTVSHPPRCISTTFESRLAARPSRLSSATVYEGRSFEPWSCKCPGPLDFDPDLDPTGSLAAAERGMDNQASRSISTGQLNTLQCLHLRPINVVVFDGASGACARDS